MPVMEGGLSMMGPSLEVILVKERAIMTWAASNLLALACSVVSEDKLSESLSEYATRAGLGRGVAGCGGKTWFPEVLAMMPMQKEEIVSTRKCFEWLVLTDS
jgi:hypothetical protein